MLKYHSHRYDLRWNHIYDLSDGRPDLKGIKPSVEACNHFELGHINKVSKEGLPEEFQTLVSSFNKMSKRINLLIHEVFVKQQEKQETELQLLRTQINPIICIILWRSCT